jgi:hypothetical protein
LSISNACSCRISALYLLPRPLRQIFDLFQENFRVFQKNSKANFKKFQTWVSIFIFQFTTHVNSEFHLTTCYLDRLRQIFDHFSRKFQSFSGKLLRKFQKIPNINIHYYSSISNEWSCPISALYLLLRPTYTNFWPFFMNISEFFKKTLKQISKNTNS